MEKAIIFDLDGTLWDSSEQVVPAWNEVLLRYPQLNRHITLQDMQGYMGKTMNDIAELMLPNIPAKESHRIMKECCEHENSYLEQHGGILYPMLEKTLSQLCEQYKLYIVSNCQDGYIQVFLCHHKLEKYFSDFESQGATGKLKWENIKLVISRNGINSAVYVGDTQLDMESADLAGIPFIHAAYGFGAVNREVPRLHSFSALPQLASTII